MLNDVVDSRTVTTTGLSIGTGLAIETLFAVEAFDKDRNRPELIKMEEYSGHIYNVYTLFRNVLSSIKHRDKDELVADRLVQEQLVNDMYLIKELYKDVKTQLIFYAPDYSRVYKRFNKGKPDTPYRPYVTHSYMVSSLKKLALPGNVVHTPDLAPVAGLGKLNSKVLLLTHFAVDLLNAKYFPKLELLESHTGVIKDKLLWGTKYHPLGKRDFTSLPFHTRLLYSFGDKTLTKPLSVLDRRALYELIMTHDWTPLTTKDAINKLTKEYNNKIPV